jgi:hypothetical protein
MCHASAQATFAEADHRLRDHRDHRALRVATLGDLAALLRRLLQSHACSSTVLVDEFDAGRFKAPPNYVEGGSSRLMNSSFQLTHRYYPNSRFFGEFLLAPVKETSGGSTLRGGNHGDRFAQIVDSINSVGNRLTLKSIYFRYICRF